MNIKKCQKSSYLAGNLKKQQGVVLVVSLVFLIALTAVAAALMQNTTTDMKMSGASEEKVVAIQEAISAVDEVIHEQVTGISADNDFAAPVVYYQLNGAKDVSGDLSVTNKDNDITAATVNLANNQFMLEAGCPHSKSASSAQVFACNVLIIQIDRKYGRNGTSTVQVNSGIAQHLLK
jgi:type IV pilus assembly protein PilX